MADHHIAAYGRSYKSAHDVKLDLLGGRDFTITDISSPWNGKPINLAQMKQGDVIYCRYANMTKVVRIVVDDAKFTFAKVLTKREKQVLADLAAKRSADVKMTTNIEVSLRDARLISVHHGSALLTMKGLDVAMQTSPGLRLEGE